MGLLEKFDSVEVKTDDRISESDRIFCETYQKAYDKARETLSELKYQWEDIEQAQRDILKTLGSDARHKLFIEGTLKITADDIEKQLEENHEELIDKIVSHFNNIYHVSVSERQVAEVLLPIKPEGGWRRNEEEWAQYHSSLQALALHYEDIVDQVLIQLGGRSFMERAVDELKEKCHNAAWNSYTKKADYEVKKDVLRLTHYACSFKEWCSREEWSLHDGAKEIMRGIAHFETGGFHFFPLGFSELLSYGGPDTSSLEFTTCDKLKQIRMFKNGRVDIKFASELFAKQFAEEYLGLVY